MSFQDYCTQLIENDGQEVSVNNTFVISFSNANKKIFTIDPSAAINFMKFLLQSYEACYSAWSEVKGNKKPYTIYEQNSYRAIFRAASGMDDLVAISSLGGSQTRQMTSVLTKLICYLGGFEYIGVDKNTYFDRDSLAVALGSVPTDLAELACVTQPICNVDLGEKFKTWMRDNEYAERSISSYGNVNFANQLLSKIITDFQGIYSISNVTTLDEFIQKLDAIPDWNEKNDSGKGMYIAGLKKYREFLLFFNNTLPVPKPFLLLAGISGTGKTRFVREQAKASCKALNSEGQPDNYCLIPVRPDWHEPSDLLGYVSRIGANGSARYVVTDLLRFVVRAWLDAAAPAGASTTVLPCKSPDEMTPYWLCLDEMNLAPVEQYFADYLSVVESRKWTDDKYTCDPLLKGATIKQLGDEGRKALREELKLDDPQYDGLWGYFLEKGIPLPPNLIVAGTVNMDETTHGFSRKVIDRAFTIDFGEFYPNDFNEFLSAKKSVNPKKLSFPVLSCVTASDLSAFDADGKQSIAFLSAINEVLKGTPFELAYRALNELLLAVVCFKPEGKAQLQAVWDDFLMSKVLPRIDGDTEKLSKPGKSEQTDSRSDVLMELLSVIETQLEDILAAKRPDLLCENPNMIRCRAKKKLTWMQRRLTDNGFTTFWP